MNAFKRASLKLSHAVKHKTLSGGSTEEIVDEALEKRLSEHKAYEEKVKTLQALTLDARAQLGEVFFTDRQRGAVRRAIVRSSARPRIR